MNVLSFDCGLRNLAAAVVRIVPEFAFPPECKSYYDDTETADQFKERALAYFVRHAWTVVHARLIDISESLGRQERVKRVKSLGLMSKATGIYNVLDELEQQWFADSVVCHCFLKLSYGARCIVTQPFCAKARRKWWQGKVCGFLRKKVFVARSFIMTYCTLWDTEDALEAGSRRNRRLVWTMYPTAKLVLTHTIGVFVLRVVKKDTMHSVPPVFIQVPVFPGTKTPKEFCAYASVTCYLPPMTCICVGIVTPEGRRAAVAADAARTGAEYKAGEMVYLFVEPF